MRFETDRAFFSQRPESDELVLFIHGKGGNAEEAEHCRQFFPGKDVYGFDYKSQNPWEAKKEFGDMIAELSEKYNRITLIAVSIGAYFSMNAGIGKFIDKASFISLSLTNSTLEKFFPEKTSSILLELNLKGVSKWLKLVSDKL